MSGEVYVTANELKTEMIPPVLRDFVEALRKRAESLPHKERLAVQHASNLLASASDALRLAGLIGDGDRKGNQEADDPQAPDAMGEEGAS